MITDEQILDLAEQHDDSVFMFASELIALAQEVKPLEFERDEDGDYVAVSAFGRYVIYLSFTQRTYQYNNTRYNTLDEAIESAQQDYRHRVLSCLVNGGE